MNEFNCNDPAFPCGFHPEGNSADQRGMSYRQWLIGQALAGACATITADAGWPAEKMARFCIARADAVIAEMSEPEEPTTLT